MFDIMICNITKLRIRLSICTSSEVVLSSICSLCLSVDVSKLQVAFLARSSRVMS